MLRKVSAIITVLVMAACGGGSTPEQAVVDVHNASVEAAQKMVEEGGELESLMDLLAPECHDQLREAAALAESMGIDFEEFLVAASDGEFENQKASATDVEIVDEFNAIVSAPSGESEYVLVDGEWYGACDE